MGEFCFYFTVEQPRTKEGMRQAYSRLIGWHHMLGGGGMIDRGRGIVSGLALRTREKRTRGKLGLPWVQLQICVHRQETQSKMAFCCSRRRVGGAVRVRWKGGQAKTTERWRTSGGREGLAWQRSPCEHGREDGRGALVPLIFRYFRRNFCVFGCDEKAIFLLSAGQQVMVLLYSYAHRCSNVRRALVRYNLTSVSMRCH